MASTIYRRPDLFPFPLSSIADWTGVAGNFGTTDDALQYLTNLLTFQVSVSWSFTYSFSGPTGTESESYSLATNLPLFIPAFPASTNSSWISWYNTDLVGNKRPNPAARVLYNGSGTDPIARTFTSVPVGLDQQDLDLRLYLNRIGGVINLALQLVATGNLNGGIFFSASFVSIPNRTLTSIPVNLMGTLVPLYLLVSGGPNVGDFTFISPITFSATVTPTFAAA